MAGGTKILNYSEQLQHASDTEHKLPVSSRFRRMEQLRGHHEPSLPRTFFLSSPLVRRPNSPFVHHLLLSTAHTRSSASHTAPDPAACRGRATSAIAHATERQATTARTTSYSVPLTSEPSRQRLTSAYNLSRTSLLPPTSARSPTRSLKSPRTSSTSRQSSSRTRSLNSTSLTPRSGARR